MVADSNGPRPAAAARHLQHTLAPTTRSPHAHYCMRWRSLPSVVRHLRRRPRRRADATRRSTPMSLFPTRPPGTGADLFLLHVSCMYHVSACTAPRPRDHLRANIYHQHKVQFAGKRRDDRGAHIRAVADDWSADCSQLESHSCPDPRPMIPVCHPCGSCRSSRLRALLVKKKFMDTVALPRSRSIPYPACHTHACMLCCTPPMRHDLCVKCTAEASDLAAAGNL